MKFINAPAPKCNSSIIVLYEEIISSFKTIILLYEGDDKISQKIKTKKRKSHFSAISKVLISIRGVAAVSPLDNKCRETF